MSQADELLNMLTDDDVSTDNNSDSNAHIVISNTRHITVPASLRRIAVQYDHNVETVTFDCPRYWDGHDMAKMAIYINFTMSNGVGGTYVAKNVRIDKNDSSIMHFDWTILQNATLVSGPLSFLVCIKNTDEDGNELNHWNSELNHDMYVSPGLKTKSSTVNETEFDIVSQLMDRVNTMSIPTIDYNNVSNALKGSVEGSSVSITDISTLEHELDVKVTSKNLADIGILFNHIAGTGPLFDKQPDGSYLSNQRIGGYTAEVYLPPAVYTVSYYLKSPETLNYRIDLLYEDGASVTDRKSSTGEYVYFNYTTDGNRAITGVRFSYGAASSDNIQIKDFQIEVGATATEYTPYIADLSEVTMFCECEPDINPTEYTINADGSVDGIPFIYPSITLYTDNEGAIIHCNYNKDLNKVITALTQAIITLGGTI